MLTQSRCVLNRKGRVTRKSRETQLAAGVDLEGRGRAEVSTGLDFLDHMLEQVSRYGGFDLRLRGTGDLQVDPHHLVEDAGIVLGQALSQAMGDRDGITRFASAYAPLDESLARVVIDLGQRPFLSYNVALRGRIGTLESEVVEEFWRAFSIHLGATIHVDLIRGRNRHHMAEATFKALGLALRAAMAPTGRTGVPSSKGVLG
ncbi:MAG: imidazoleglycerol-phosphate dehydratase HisB [Chloroflexi bacterium]|nr:MAG: imidazoleglycerol-phosphate dehydratase HisB [Chloroflexota bacterium]